MFYQLHVYIIHIYMYVTVKEFLKEQFVKMINELLHFLVKIDIVSYFSLYC